MPRPISQPALTYLSVFSGLGGIDLGLESAGFESRGCIELDQIARESLASNRPGWKLIEPCEAVHASEVLTPSAIGLRKRQLTLLAGGPPCQPFSKAAQWSPTARRGMRDKRAKCLAGYLRLVETFLPRAILIENVQGFVTGDTSALSRIVARLKKINKDHKVNYQLQHWIINAADYGVPQRRARAILFAARNGAQVTLPTPTHANAPVTAWDAIGNLDSPNSDLHPTPNKNWLELLPSIPEGMNYLWHTPHGGGKPLFGYRTRYWSFLLKLAKEQPAWTLPAQPGPFTGPFHWDNRPLTSVEMLRLQSFPYSWIVSGSRREQIRQIGNATPPLLVEVIGRCIRAAVFDFVDDNTPILSIPRSEQPVPPPSRTIAIPRKFLKLVDAWPDHPGTGKGPQPVSIVRASNEKKSSQSAKVRRSNGEARRRSLKSA